LSSRWLAAKGDNFSEFKKEDLQEFSALQKREFVSLLLDSCTTDNMPVAKLEALDRLYELSAITNSEIQFR
jgi:hypothetical protein